MDDPSTPDTPPADAPPPDSFAALAHFTPVPRLRDRSNGWKPHVQRAFIEALAETGSVAAACRRVGRAEHGVYQLRRHPDAHEFRAAWDAALDLGVRRIEDGAMDRALYGTEETIHYHGELVGKRRRFNERLVMFILRNRAPHRFAAGGGPKGLNAASQMERERLKKQWRKEWEEEQEANSVSPAEIRASIERKIAGLRAQVVARTSPRAFEWEITALAQKRADEAVGWRPGDPYHDYAEAAEALLPKFIEEVRAEFPAHAGWDGVPYKDDDDDDDDDDNSDDDDGDDYPPALPAPKAQPEPPPPAPAAVPEPHDPSLDQARARILAAIRARAHGDDG